MQTLSLGSTGPDVQQVQSLLHRIGYNAGPVDSFFGQQTRQAVMAFQRDQGLYPDGIVGPATWGAMNKFLLGYSIYTVRPGDTVYNIARKFYTTVNAIITANPGINPNVIYIGQQLVVPYGIDVVYTDVQPTYEMIDRQITGLKVRYPFLETGIAGKGVLGKNLYYVRLGTGSNEVSYNASHHANEYITTTMLMKFIESYSKAYSTGSSLRGYNITQLYNRSSIYVIPLVNPDGVDLVNYWPNYTDPAYIEAAKINTTGLPLPSVWKANIRGTDLNLNYPAAWDKEKESEIEQGITGPAPRDYGGPSPLSEPESSGMADFTKRHNFRLVIAYHTQGGVIFWQFLNLAPPESLPIARRFASISGYEVSPGYLEAAFAGYKDWFIQDFKKPGYTIEVGSGTNPIPMSQLPDIYNRNEGVLLEGAVV